LKAAADDVSRGMSYSKASFKWNVGQTTLFTIVKNPNHRLEKQSSIMSEENNGDDIEKQGVVIQAGWFGKGENPPSPVKSE
jgi:hypothetical protein